MKNLNGEESQHNPKIEMTKAIDLINRVKNEPEPKIIWNGIVEGSKGLIVGVSKTGKTTLAEALAISIATGKEQFAGYPLSGNPEKVLFINLEESYSIRSWRNSKQIATLNDHELELFGNNYYSTPTEFPEFLTTTKDWSTLSEYIDASDANYVFIDSLSHMFEGQIENSTACVEFIKKFREHIMSLNKTIIIIHHNIKGNDRPIDQDCIAGSRMILQEFNYAIGLSNIPTRQGGNYMCMLYNKFIPKDDAKADLYSITASNWVESVGVANKFDLYKDVKPDYRFNDDKKNQIYDYIASQSCQYDMISSKELQEHFLETGLMSRDTLFKKLKSLIAEEKLIKDSDANYGLFK